eukprot:CAMPEP_0119405582 /NCGR_PEP_ID=MMETSP1335-20130426/140_1 /TAXON_ID=259385 /ORGANISM="Chrysoculter rhomboideus, Strain RCC1486" /LENGTH=84 /DNA_ID=CAMNT_0007429581 /DNA_START=84 /DNA_END=338 /DNA_ORIENTATION=+
MTVTLTARAKSREDSKSSVSSLVSREYRGGNVHGGGLGTMCTSTAGLGDQQASHFLHWWREHVAESWVIRCLHEELRVSRWRVF